MSKLIADIIQRPGGAALSFPASDGTTGQFLKTDASGNLSFGAGATFPTSIAPIIAPESKGIVGSVSSTVNRANNFQPSPWTSTGPGGTYINYQAYLDPNLIQFVNMCLGDGKGGYGSTTENYLGDDDRGSGARALMFSNGNRLGYKRDSYMRANATGYGGHSLRMMPLRNTTNAAIIVTLAGYATDYWEQGYEGTNLFVLIPNTSVYSTVTSVTTSNMGTGQTSTDTSGTALTGTYSIPANTTVIVCLASTVSYQTTYRFKDTNYFSGVNNYPTGIICDMRMLTSLYTSRFSLPTSGTCIGTSLLAPLWTKTATNFGDR